MPDDAAAAVGFAIFAARLAVLQSFDRSSHTTILLIAAYQLYLLATVVHEQGVVTHDVQQVGRHEHTADQALLSGEVGLTELNGYLRLALRCHCLPAQVMGEASADGAHPRFVEVASHQELAGGEQSRCPLMLLDLVLQEALVVIAAQLVHRIAEALRHSAALALHHHQRDAVDEQH